MFSTVRGPASRAARLGARHLIVETADLGTTLTWGARTLGARAINAAIGTWLFISAFVWRHTYEQLENAWVVGFMAVMMALGGLSGLSWTRYFNVALGIWLVISPLFVHVTSPFTYWNHELVGAGLIVFGLMPRLHRRPSPRRS
jgi:hypothetical protein